MESRYIGRESESEKETHACMKARSHLIINSSMPLVELGRVGKVKGLPT